MRQGGPAQARIIADHLRLSFNRLVREARVAHVVGIDRVAVEVMVIQIVGMFPRGRTVADPFVLNVTGEFLEKRFGLRSGRPRVSVGIGGGVAPARIAADAMLAPLLRLPTSSRSRLFPKQVKQIAVTGHQRVDEAPIGWSDFPCFPAIADFTSNLAILS